MIKDCDNGQMEIEILNSKSNHPVRIILGYNGKIAAVDGEKVVEAASYKADKWPQEIVR